MIAADIPFGMRLKERAGWNQTEADWRRFLSLAPQGCLVAELDGRAVGSVAVFVFDTVAWIAMLLVDPDTRGRGIGTRLFDHALARIDAKVVSVRLDATPLGRPLYEKAGFAVESKLLRMVRPAHPSDQASPHSDVRAVDRRDLAAVVDLDRRATGTRRGTWLAALYAEDPDSLRAIRRGSAIAGYAASRPGSVAAFVGPVIVDPAAGVDVGRALCMDALARRAGQPVFMDVPVDNRAARAWAEDVGFRAERPLLRMGRGVPVYDDRQMIWGSSGPEKG